jgi:WD40 repeat protein
MCRTTPRARESFLAVAASAQLYALAFSPDGQYVAFGGAGDGGVQSLSWDSNEKRLHVGEGSEKKFVWNWTGCPVANMWGGNTKTYVYALSFSPDSRTLAVGGSAKKVVVYSFGEMYGEPKGMALYEIACLEVSG